MDIIKTNFQQPEKSTKQADVLDVADIFYTIQGEGPFVGRPAIFLRLAGCNLQCPACDTDYTSSRKNRHIAALALFIKQKFASVIAKTKYSSTRPLLVITGGEPFRQNLGPFVELMLHTMILDIQIETNGSLYQHGFPYEDVTIVCSPKTGAVNKKLQEHISAYKYVVDPEAVDPNDGLPLHALGHPNNGQVAKPHPHFRGDVYLQPIDTGDLFKHGVATRETARLCMEHGHRLCLQTHKIVGLE